MKALKILVSLGFVAALAVAQAPTADAQGKGGGPGNGKGGGPGNGKGGPGNGKGGPGNGKGGPGGGGGGSAAGAPLPVLGATALGQFAGGGALLLAYLRRRNRKQNAKTKAAA